MRLMPLQRKSGQGMCVEFVTHPPQGATLRGRRNSSQFRERDMKNYSVNDRE
jgi:hypothetical protein